MTRARALTVGTLALATIVVGAAVILSRSDAGRTIGGPLACPDCGGGTGAVPVPVGEGISLGVVYLRNESTTSAVLERVQLLKRDPALQMVGAFVVELTGRGSVGFSREFPPADPKGRLRRVAGYTLEPTGPGKGTVQILVGVRMSRPGSAGFRHVALDYVAGNRKYRAIFRESLGLCAPETIPADKCPQPDF